MKRETESVGDCVPYAILERGAYPPRSTSYNDVYFDHTGRQGIDRMFFAPAAIAARAHAARRFTIGELGFGSGANFLHACAVTTTPLHFISIEKHPLAPDDLATVLKPFDSPIKETLIAAYPPPVHGWHRRHFDHGRVQLSVWFGDVETGLDELVTQQLAGVDAWLLDGFAPEKNPAMWSDDVMQRIGACSATGASVTTFTAAGYVRRRLAEAGFRVERIDQTPIKRHSTLAWWASPGRSFEAPTSLRVLGAGLAGAATTVALREKGIEVELVDRRSANPTASDVPAAVVHGRLLRGRTPESSFRSHAYLYSLARLRNRAGFRPTPVVQLPSENQDSDRLIEIAERQPIVRWLDASSVAEVAGIATIDSPGLLFEDAGVADLRKLTVDLIGQTEVHDGPLEKCLTTIWATGFDLPPAATAEVTHLGGQLDRFRANAVPRIPIVGRGSFIPLSDSDLWVGATYEYQPWSREDATNANRQRFGGLFKQQPVATTGIFRAQRAVASDRIPVAGFDGRAWLNLAHGSHGTTTAPFCAECVASQLIGEVAPASMDLLALIDPHRFVVRQRRRPNPFAKER